MMTRSLYAALFLALFSLGSSHAQLYVTASGGGASELTFTIHEQIVFESTDSYSNSILMLGIQNAYSADQADLVNDSAFNSTIASFAVPADSVTLGSPGNAGIFDSLNLGPRDFFLIFQGNLATWTVGDDLILNPGTFTLGTGDNNFYTLPDNLENASLFAAAVNLGGPQVSSASIANAIPEPATTGLLLLGGAALYLRRRPRR